MSSLLFRTIEEYILHFTFNILSSNWRCEWHIRRLGVLLFPGLLTHPPNYLHNTELLISRMYNTKNFRPLPHRKHTTFPNNSCVLVGRWSVFIATIAWKTLLFCVLCQMWSSERHSRLWWVEQVQEIQFPEAKERYPTDRTPAHPPSQMLHFPSSLLPYIHPLPTPFCLVFFSQGYRQR